MARSPRIPHTSPSEGQDSQSSAANDNAITAVIESCYSTTQTFIRRGTAHPQSIRCSFSLQWAGGWRILKKRKTRKAAIAAKGRFISGKENS